MLANTSITLFLLCSAIAYGSPDVPWVAGGQPGNVGDFPYLVIILIYHVNLSHICTGSIIHEDWILTAAHCTKDFEKFVVKAGIKRLSEEESTTQVRNGKASYIHPQYENPWNLFGTNALHDYSLIQLEKSLDINNESVKVLELDDSFWEFGLGRTCTALGFGRTPEEVIDLKLYHMEVQVFRGIGSCPCFTKKAKIHGSLCFETKEDGKSLCPGDSGGPLICNGRQVGVASHLFASIKCDLFSTGQISRAGCGVEGTVSVYTYVLPMLNWIRMYVGNTIPVEPNYCANCWLFL